MSEVPTCFSLRVPNNPIYSAVLLVMGLQLLYTTRVVVKAYIIHLDQHKTVCFQLSQASRKEPLSLILD
jgi:hypothetical protein